MTMAKTETITHSYMTMPPVPVMTAEEERVIIPRWQQFRREEDIDHILRANVGFIKDTTIEYHRYHLEQDFNELFSLAAQGMFVASLRWEAERGFKFISYAVWYMKAYLTAHGNRMHSALSLPFNITMDYNDEKGEKDEHGMCYVESNHRYMRPPRIVHLDQTYAPGDRDESEQIGNRFLLEDHETPEDIVGESMRQQKMGELITSSINQLTGREQQIMVMRYGIDGEYPRTLKECGEVLGLTRERVRQIEAKATAKLKVIVARRRVEAMELIKGGM